MGYINALHAGKGYGTNLTVFRRQSMKDLMACFNKG
jgi:hypothetical protein